MPSSPSFWWATLEKMPVSRAASESAERIEPGGAVRLILTV